MALLTDTDNALLSMEDAVVYLGLGTSSGADSSSDSDTVRDLINVVSYRFNAETGRNLKARDYTSQFDGNGTNTAQLANWPLASTTITITINASRDFTSTDDQITDTDVMLDTAAAEVRLDSVGFSKGNQNVQVEYTAGYSTDAAYDLTYAAKEYLQTVWDRQTARESISVRTEAFEGISRTYELNFPWSVMQVLNTYREGRAW